MISFLSSFLPSVGVLLAAASEPLVYDFCDEPCCNNGPSPWHPFRRSFIFYKYALQDYILINLSIFYILAADYFYASQQLVLDDPRRPSQWWWSPISCRATLSSSIERSFFRTTTERPLRQCFRFVLPFYVYLEKYLLSFYSLILKKSSLCLLI